jgi:hypothetical protein
MSTTSRGHPLPLPEFDALPCKNAPETSLGVLHVRQRPSLILAAVGLVSWLSYPDYLCLLATRDPSVYDNLCTFARTDIKSITTLPAFDAALNPGSA